MKERIENRQTVLATWLAEAFSGNPYNAESNIFLQRFKQEQLTRFLARGLPSRREEAWKYADLSFLEKNRFDWPQAGSQHCTLKNRVTPKTEQQAQFVFVNGHFSPQLSSQQSLPVGVIACCLQQALEEHATLACRYLLREINVHQHPLACLNTALFADGLFLYIPSHVVLEKSIHLLSIATERQAFMMQPRHLVVIEDDAQLTLTEEYVADGTAEQYITNTVLDFFVGRNASLNYYIVQNEAQTAKHFSHTFIHQQQHSEVNVGSFAFGGQLARHELTVYLQGKNAYCNVKGFYGLGQEGQWLGHHLLMDHAAPYSKSKIDLHGVVMKPARAVFNGKVFVRPEAQKIEAKQFNHNILLSPLAEINTKPDLEIYADDVQCQHGATVGQLDEEALFYLSARGIDHHAATTILLQAFMEKMLGSVTLPWLVQALQEQWQTALANGL